MIVSECENILIIPNENRKVLIKCVSNLKHCKCGNVYIETKRIIFTVFILNYK